MFFSSLLLSSLDMEVRNNEDSVHRPCDNAVKGELFLT